MSSATSAEMYGLPPHAPPFLGEERTLLEPSRFAIFHTTSMDLATLNKLVDGINKFGTEDANHSKLAPKPDFSSRSLRDVYEYFIKLREEDESVQPYYFIVADSSFSSSGVLGVYLDCAHDGSNKIGVARCPVERADGWGADFHYGMGTWEEMKEEEEVEFGDEGEVDLDEAEVADEKGPVRLRGMYAVYSIVKKGEDENVLAMLIPNRQEGNQDECRVQLLGNFHASQDPWVEISKEHPGHAAFRQRIHRQIVIVVEKEETSAPDGVVIVRLESDKRPKVLARVSADTAIAEADATVKRLKLWNPWEPAHYRTSIYSILAYAAIIKKH